MRPIEGSFQYTNWLFKTLNEEYMHKQKMKAECKCYCEYLKSSDRAYPSTDKCDVCREIEQMMRDAPKEWDYNFARKCEIEDNLYDGEV